MLEVTPLRGPVDGPLTILATDPRAKITARLTDPRGVVWSATAEAPVDGQDLVGAMMPTNGEAGAFPESSVASFTIAIDASVDGTVAHSITAERWFVGPDCIATPLREDGLVGTFFRPRGDGPFPAVVAVGGSAGGEVFGLQSAALLAGHGYACLSLAYHGVDGVAPHLVEIPLEYFARAMAWLERQPQVRAGTVAVVGRSRGGELALLLGSVFPQVRAVIAYTPSDVVWGGLRGTTPATESAWSLGGAPVPYLNFTQTPEQMKALLSNVPAVLRPAYEESARQPEARAAATIAVERIRGPILLVSGTDDEMWPATPWCDAIVARLASHGHAHPVTHVRCEGAGHHLRAPGVPAATVAPRLAMGGSLPAQAEANRTAWTEVLRTLALAADAPSRP